MSILSGSRYVSLASLAILLLGELVGCTQPQRRVLISSHTGYDGKVRTKAVAFSTPADLRLAFLREENSGVVYCAEPMPDVALNSEASASGSLSAASALAQAASAAANASLMQENEALRKDLNDAILMYERSSKSTYNRTYSSQNSRSTSASDSLSLQAAYKLAITASELGGRSQQVLLAREFLYRLCEARANGHLPTDGAVFAEMQGRALAMIESISKPASSTSMAERTLLLQRLNDLATTQKGICETQQKACVAVVEKDEAKIKDCGKVFKACIDNLAQIKFSESVGDDGKTTSHASGTDVTGPKKESSVPAKAQ